MGRTSVQTPSKTAGNREWDIYCQTKQEEEHEEFERLRSESKRVKSENSKLQSDLLKAQERIEMIRKTTTREIDFLRKKLRLGSEDFFTF